MARFFQAEAMGLFRYAHTLPNVNRPEAEDLVQVTFQTAALEWERRLSFLDESSRRKWLYRVLRNKAIDRWRAIGSRELSSGQAAGRSGPAQETHNRALSSIVLQRCWDRIAEMPEARQRIAFLKWSEEWTSSEIADLLGISQSTVRAQLKLARDDLAAEIGPEVQFGDTGEEVAW